MLSIELGIFQQNLTNGQGFIAIALVYFGAWRPVGVMGGALLFGMVSATVLQWKTLGLVSGAASSLTAMAPALLTIVALVVISRTVAQPAALTRPFELGRGRRSCATRISAGTTGRRNIPQGGKPCR